MIPSCSEEQEHAETRGTERIKFYWLFHAFVFGLATFNLVTLVTSEITFFKSSLHSRCDVVKENAL